MRGLLNSYGIENIYILGAGFSRPLGLPLTSELFGLVYDIAKSKEWFDDGKPVKFGQAEWLLEEMQYYYPTLNITHENFKTQTLNIDIEEFLSLVSTSSFFIENTSEKWDNHGSKFNSWLKKWIAEAIYNQQLESDLNPSSILDHFVQSLDKSIIITFNWDTMLEQAMDRNNIEYSYQLDNGIINHKTPILKLHGSIDWFLPRECDYKKLGKRYFIDTGERFKKYVSDLTDCYSEHMTPYIVTPNFEKISQLKEFGNLWTMPWALFQNKIDVKIIGFSMRNDDFHTRAFIYPQLFIGSKSNDIIIRVLDYATELIKEDELRAKFKGIENIEFNFGGFNLGTLEWILK